MRLAAINLRSLNQEIVQRLQASIDQARGQQRQRSTATVVHTNEALATDPAQSDAHRQLTSMFDGMTPDKQLALLTLLRRP